jgi:hypothetical protein
MSRQFDLLQISIDQCTQARSHREGRSSISLHEGESSVLRQTVTALLTGHTMEIELPPAEGWILILEGSLRIALAGDGDDVVTVSTGALLQLPHEAMTLTAAEDCTLLLTVAMGDRPR